MRGTAVALMLLFAIGEARPIRLRYRGRAESIVAGALAVAVATALTAVTEAVQQLSSACSIPEFDDRWQSVVAHVLLAGRVEIVDSPPHALPRDRVTGRLGETTWVIGHDPQLRAPGLAWTATSSRRCWLRPPRAAAAGSDGPGG